MIITGQFNDSLPPIMDGVAITAKNYAYWLNHNHDASFAIGPSVPLYTEDENYVLRFKSLRLKKADPYRLGVPKIDSSFNSKIEQIPFDLIHAHCPFVSGNYALALAKKRKIPLVATFHSKYRDDFASWMKLKMPVDQATQSVVHFYNHADAVWVPNEAIIDTFREYGFRGNIRVVPNGSDMGTSPEKRASIRYMGRQFLGLDEGVPCFLYVGQHRFIKNLKLIIESLSALKKQNFLFKMVFIGDGPDKEEMVQLAKTYHLESHIDFKGPIYHREELEKAYAGADLFLFPSLYDNASLATREAAGFYLPTLFIEGATTANGIIDGQSGYLSENTPLSYAQKIKDILKDPLNFQQVQEGAHKTLFTPWESIVDKVYEHYEEIVDRFKFDQLKKIMDL